MSHAAVTRSEELAIVTLARGKVNALDHPLVRELTDRLAALERDATVRGIVLTGKGKFFSFGFDIPQFLSFTKDEFIAYLTDFTGLYTRVWSCPKPVVAALNGHTIAGACMLATSCDYRVMARGKGKISLNEITFGATVFAGCVEMLRACAGHRNAERILYSGAMYPADEALSLGLVDAVTEPDELMKTAQHKARELAGQDPVAFRSIKRMVRGPIADQMRAREPAAVREFADIWYSPETWERLKRIEIRK
jgi:enoyl-CoA hydratase/carnithine racemase